MQIKPSNLLLTGLLLVGSSTFAVADIFDDFVGNHSAPANPTNLPAAPALPVGNDGLPGSFSMGGMATAVPVPSAIPEAGGSIGNLPAEATLPVAQPEPPRMSQGELNARMWDAARAGDTTTVAAMLQQGANIGFASRYGETALHAATAAGSLQTAIYLVNAGANINATTSNGWTPLHHAARFGRADIANFLMNQGASLNVTTTENPPKTPMQMALDKGDLRIARMLGY